MDFSRSALQFREEQQRCDFPIQRRNRVTRLKLLSAALAAAALLAAPAIARESHVTSRGLTEDANTCTDARYIGGHPCDRAGVLHGHERDEWGHWGAYYGPMVHVP